MGHDVRGAGTLTLDGGSYLQLLVYSVRRVKKAKSAGGPNKQIHQEATRFQANTGYGSMDDDYKSNYHESSTGGGRYGLEKFRVPKV